MWSLHDLGAPAYSHKDIKLRDAAEMSEARADRPSDSPAHIQDALSRRVSICHELAEGASVRRRIVSMHPYFKAPVEHVCPQREGLCISGTLNYII